MPYMTRYHLGWHKATGPTAEEIALELQQRVQKGNEDDMSDHPQGYWELVIQGDLNATWYEHQMDMANVVSRKWPEAKFALYGEGDVDEDIWAEYFLNGMVHRVQGEKKYPDFDPEQLTDPKLPAV